MGQQRFPPIVIVCKLLFVKYGVDMLMTRPAHAEDARAHIITMEGTPRALVPMPHPGNKVMCRDLGTGPPAELAAFGRFPHMT